MMEFDTPPEDLMAWVKWKMRKALDDELMVAIMYGEPLGRFRLVFEHPIYGEISSGHKDLHTEILVLDDLWVECEDWPTGFWTVLRGVRSVIDNSSRLDLYVQWSRKNPGPHPEWTFAEQEVSFNGFDETPARRHREAGER